LSSIGTSVVVVVVVVVIASEEFSDVLFIVTLRASFELK
jgi:hypothetical protein